MIVVIDTSIIVSSLLSGSGLSRRVMVACLQGRLQPVVGTALLSEYEDVLSRNHLWHGAPTTATEREVVIDAFLSKCKWVEVYFAWRPNLPDEADNHVIELALAAQAQIIVTRNVRDLRRGELKFPLRILTPQEIWEQHLCQR